VIPAQLHQFINQRALLLVAERLVTDAGGVNQLFTTLVLQQPIVRPDRGSQGNMPAEATVLQR
jgi:hypothetical protein